MQPSLPSSPVAHGTLLPVQYPTLFKSNGTIDPNQLSPGDVDVYIAQ